MQVSASISAAIRASATASARSSGAMGPAVTVEPSPEAIGAVQAVFALAPQLLADSELEGGAALAPFTSASPALAAAAAATAGAAHHAPAPAKRQRLTPAPARADQLVLQEASMQRVASAQATAAMQQQFSSMVEVVMQPGEPATTDVVCGHKPQTPQQMVPRRTSAPY